MTTTAMATEATSVTRMPGIAQAVTANEIQAMTNEKRPRFRSARRSALHSPRGAAGPGYHRAMLLVTWLAGVRVDNGWGNAFADYDNDGDLDRRAIGPD